MTQTPDPPAADILAQLAAYAVAPRGNRAGRTWAVDELLALLDSTVSITAIAERLGAPRAALTYELVRLRRAGFPVPQRPGGGPRSPRTIAIENDLRAGMTDAEVSRRYGVSPARVREVRVRAGLPTTRRLWTEEERDVLITHQGRPTPEVAEMVGRTVRAVDAERSQLIAQGRITPRIVRRHRDGAGRLRHQH